MKGYMYKIIALVVIAIAPLPEPPRREAEREWKDAAILDERLVPVHDMIWNHLSDLDDTRELDRVVTHFMRQWDVVGASLAITRGGKLVYSKGYGFADREVGEPMNVNHIFRVASISKLNTAVGIMKLAEEGRL